MSLDDDLFRSLTGQSLEEVLRPEITLESELHSIEVQMMSGFPLRTLGVTEDNLHFHLTEEERESHIHILGAPGEGKSKFIEMLVRQDIDSGFGACVLDPSENGDTALKLLKYCASIGFKKVCYINPVDFLEFNRVPVFNPIKYAEPAAVSVGNTIDALQVLWSSTFNNTPRIQRYATALLHALHASEMTLVESLYFFTRGPEANKILESLPPNNLHREVLTMTTASRVSSLDTTLNRFGVFQDDTLRLMLGSKQSGIPFETLIRDGWLILVNLDPQSVWGTEQIQQRLLGTLIINEIVHAIHRLNNQDWRGAYYLYIDEVGDYATSKLAYILDKKRKTGLRFTVAHQRFEQLEDSNVLSAVRGSAKIKALFYTPNLQDRTVMLKDMGFGGDDVTDRKIAHLLGELERQHCAIRVHRRPVIVRLNDVPDVYVSRKELDVFKETLYSYPWFYRPQVIKQEISARFPVSINPEREADDAGRPKTKGARVAPGAAKADGRTDGKAGPPPKKGKRRRVKTAFSEEDK